MFRPLPTGNPPAMQNHVGQNDHYDQVEQAIIEISWLGQRQFMQLLADERFDLTIPQFYTLMYLAYRAASCKMSDLARETHQSAASLTGVVDRLLDKQLVERTRSDADRRQVVVVLADRGRQLLEEILQARHDQINAALSHIPPSELDNLLRLLDMVLAGMLTQVKGREQT